MPTDSFYTRSNFEVPSIDPDSWRLTVTGGGATSAVLSMSELQSFGEHTELVVLECAGNGRILMDPTPAGAPWGLGAVSVAEFTGTPLAGVLQEAGVPNGVVEFVFTGMDRGTVEPQGEIDYQFGLDAAAALSDGPLLVWQMNDQPLTPEHGAPLRLLVPGNYGMSSVKWLSGISAVDRPFSGHFRMKYRYLEDPTAAEGEPVERMRVRSLIASPVDGAEVGESPEIRGIAWSGSGPIRSVAVRIDGGAWIDAEIGAPLGRWAPTPWSLRLSLQSGRHAIETRATDSDGNVQPLASIWNRNGYGNNVVHSISVRVAD
jgi:DMSO/TMAO reductase YedYZ molybdopterin-dependent catalytic subunit